jgi:serine/threonine protein kinase/tetratricopeptide (TPR) repeat protein
MPPPSRTQAFRGSGDDIRRLTEALRGRYTIERKIAAGGMATVYVARDLKHDRRVAIKVLRWELAALVGTARFLAEIRTTANLQHPHILPLHDSGEADGTVYYVMPYIDGESLRDRLVREGQLPIDDAIQIATEVADALQHAHHQGVIHRDIKPENILLRDGHALVADFGIAISPTSDGDSRLTEIGTSMGTPAYMSPEQAAGERRLDARSDVYALAAVLYEMLVGDPPFAAGSVQAMLGKLLVDEPSGIASRRVRVPAHVEAAILRGLEKLPADRFASVRDFAAALRDPSSIQVSPGMGSAAAISGGPSTGGASSVNAIDTGPTRIAKTPNLAVTEPIPNSGGGPKYITIPVPTRRRAALIVAALVVSAIGVWFGVRDMQRGSSAVAAAPQATVLIGTVTNRTGDSTLDALLPELLATSLEQSHTVAVYPRANVPFVLRRMQRPPETIIDDSVGREIATREGLAAVLEESITKLDPGTNSSYVLVVSAVLPDGRQLVSSRQTFADLGELPARVDSVGNALRKAFGESAALVRASTPLEQVTSRSLDAVRLYSLGRERFNSGDPLGAMPLLQRAIELDSGFAMAHGLLGIAYTNVLDMVNATRHLQIAARLASQAPPAEREKILADYAMSRRDFSAACPHYQVLMALRPRDYTLPIAFGWCSAQKLDFAAAVSATERGFQMQETPKTRINRAIVAFLAGNLTQARDDAHMVRTQVPNSVQAWYVEAKAVLALGDYATARAMYQQMIAQGGDMAVTGHDGLADLARSTGRIDEARGELELAHRDAIVRGNLAVATNAAASLAELALERHRPADFRAAMATVGPRSPDPWVVYRVGRAWARAGNAAEVDSTIQALDSLAIGPSPQFDALESLLRAELAIATSQPEKAVSEAEAAVRFEPSTVAYETLARADLAAQRAKDAAKAYEQVVRRGHERCESYDSPACYRAMEATYWLGRLKDEAGDHAGAAPLLRKFVTAWAGAKGQPMFDDATRRLAR